MTSMTLLNIGLIAGMAAVFALAGAGADHVRRQLVLHRWRTRQHARAGAPSRHEPLAKCPATSRA